MTLSTDMNIKNAQGQVPLHAACIANNLSVAALLLRNGGAAHAQDILLDIQSGTEVSPKVVKVWL